MVNNMKGWELKNLILVNTNGGVWVCIKAMNVEVRAWEH